MITRRTALGLLAATATLPSRLMAAGPDDLEAPFLAQRIARGELPARIARLPRVTRVMDLAAVGGEPGLHGGALRTLIGSQKDIRLMTICGYSRLVGYDRNLVFVADILESFEAVEDRIYTFRIRDGHCWSDGQPVSTEDFRYCWEDVLGNEDLQPGGVPRVLLTDGKPPVFEIVDPLTVRYTWEKPNPDFLPQLAAPQAQTLLLPAHYLKQFHKKYQTKEKLQDLIVANKVKKWSALHIKMARSYRPENPALPTLDPWRNTTELPAEQFVFERNPFFHRVDKNGRQLPYIDQVILGVSSPTIIPAKCGAGESDLQFTNVDFSDYTFMKAAEHRHPVKVSLWKKTIGSRIAMMPNLNYTDPVWQKVLRDANVRRAISIAIDRHEINLAIFYGLGTESADTLLPSSPLYKREYANAWIQHDPAKADEMLDAAGLQNRDDDGIRFLPDGRRMEIVVETPGETTLDTDVLELVADHLEKVGLKVFVRVSQRDIFRNRALAGQIMMSVWSGLDNGIATADMNPGDIAPTTEDQLQWPLWGIHYMTSGEKGIAPDVPEAVQLMDLFKAWRSSTTAQERTDIWGKMLTIYTQNVFSIGLVNQTHQPVLAASRLRNVPADGLFGFEPTAYLGVYNPDTFWLQDT